MRDCMPPRTRITFRRNDLSTLNQICAMKHTLANLHKGATVSTALDLTPGDQLAGAGVMKVVGSIPRLKYSRSSWLKKGRVARVHMCTLLPPSGCEMYAHGQNVFHYSDWVKRRRFEHRLLSRVAYVNV